MKVLKIANWHLVALLSIISLLTLTASVRASTLQVLPVGLVLSASKPASSISMINSGEEPVVVQGQLVEWKLVDGENVFSPTDEIVFNPPVFTVAPGKSQTIRVGVTQPLNNVAERSYRLFLEEVPNAEAAKGTVKMALRFSLPIYVSPIVPTQENLAIDTEIVSSFVTVKLANTGNVRTTIKHVTLFSESTGKQLTEHTAHFNLISGGSSGVTLTMPDALPPGHLRVLVETATGKKFEASVFR